MARATRSSARNTESVKPEKAEPQQLSSPPATPAPAKRASIRSAKVKAEAPVTPASTGRKRSRKEVKVEDDGDVDALPHNLGTALPSPDKEADGNAAEAAEPPKKRTRKLRGKKGFEDDDDHDDAVEVKDELAAAEDAATQLRGPKSKVTPKKANYGLTPGASPYPDYPHPTPEECAEVVRLLEKVHGKVQAPKAIPPPSLDVAGCGEVPSVLDAMIRTRLSANTTNKNSSTAFQGLVKRFGVLKDGIGKGSVDWDAVRRAPQQEVFKAIQHGGLAQVKSKDIKAILQMAYEENQARMAALESSGEKDPAGAEVASDGEKQEEVAKAKQNVISLDHIHLLSTPDAISKMLTYPGIGPKTASCVALFCLQRPSFAVDTHVFRLCQYLSWVPSKPKKGQPKVDRNTTYSHCDARIPDEYKYALHYLLIKHGKACPRCRAITGQAGKGWEEGCPIEHLVKRHGSKKGGMSQVDRKRAKNAATEGKEESAAEVDGEESELSDVPEDE